MEPKLVNKFKGMNLLTLNPLQSEIITVINKYDRGPMIGRFVITGNYNFGLGSILVILVLPAEITQTRTKSIYLLATIMKLLT